MKEINFNDFNDFTRNITINDTFNYLATDGSDRSLFKNSHKLSFLFERPRVNDKKHVEYTFDIADDPFKFATDNIYTNQRGLMMMRNVFFNGAIRNNLQRLFESGILQMMYMECVDELANKLRIKGHQKQAEYSTLTWDQLYPGFYVWLAASIACIFVFMGEIIVFNIKKH